jgi:two-component system, chemotaxis family, response regulator Rcp1
VVRVGADRPEDTWGTAVYPRTTVTRSPGSTDGLVHILVAEDSAADAGLIREAMRGSSVATELHIVPDGVEALAYLHGTGRYSGMPRPSMIFLDLNMPRKDGREVLREIKADAGLRRIPVIILSSSAAEEDVNGAYDRHANVYIRKPVDFEAFRGIVRQIESFWFSAAELPDD